MSCVNYTPFAHLTDAEIMREVMNKQQPTDLEVELMLRLERLHNEIEDLMTPIVGETYDHDA